MVEQITKDELMVKDILSAAKMLFARHGLKKTTMEDIAIAMGKGKSTLYYYFPGKTEIFEAVVEEEMKNLVRLTRRAINAAVSARDKLKAYSRVRVSMMEKFHNLSIVVYQEILNHLGDILKLKHKHDEIQIELISEIIKGGVETGEFKELADKEIELFSCSLAAAFRGLELPISISKVVRNYENGTDVLINIVVDGIRK